MKFLPGNAVVKISYVLSEPPLSEAIYIVEVFTEKTLAHSLVEAIKNLQVLHEVIMDNFNRGLSVV